MKGLLLAAIALPLLIGCGGSTLERWHTASLDEEFTVKKLDEIQSFDDYRRLEDRLFQQLDEEVYAETATGPEFALVRYSSGSAADPRGRAPDWNRSVELAVEEPRGGVLLLHGMSDSPYSLRALAEKFHDEGFQVLVLRLPGHGTAPVGLTRASAEDMSAAVRLAMEYLGEKLRERPIHIVGYSTGAPLAINYALDAMEGKAGVEPASLVLISPAIGVSPAAALAKWKRRLSLLPGLDSLAWLQLEPEFDPYKYNSFATKAAEQVFRLTRLVSRRIANWDGENPQHLLPPTLVLKSTVDATVSNAAVIDNLLAKLSPQRHALVLFDINRTAKASILLVSDPGPHTRRLMEDATLPFQLTLVSNTTPESKQVNAQHKLSFSAQVSSVDALDLAWPPRVISLSHVALPFAPGDSLYGQHAPDDPGILFLGQMAVQGERGLLKVSSDWLLRLRYNPFYDYLEERVMVWTGADNSR